MDLNREKLIDFIKKVEGVRLKAYKDQAGIWTISAGITGPGIYEGMEITEEESDEMLNKKLTIYINIINLCVKPPLNENQKIALISFVYNIGEYAFKRSSVLSLLNSGNFKGACDHMMLWTKVGAYHNKGLENRRQKEIVLFNTLP